MTIASPPLEPARQLPLSGLTEDMPAQVTASATFPVVAIGASAGGLEACRTLFAAIAPNAGMAFILVQHLDPTHESLIVELLTGHTVLKVSEAKEGVTVEADHLYVIPPGAYLAVTDGKLRLSLPTEPHGSRLPFDYLLSSLASDLGPRAVCVVLSGTGSDGSLGLKSIHEHGGFVIAQNPDEAGYGGMPRSAILTDQVDQILALKDIPAALNTRSAPAQTPPHKTPDLVTLTEENIPATAPNRKSLDGPLAEIVDLLRVKTAHDFPLYKPGTLERRTERRMMMAGIDDADMPRYLDFLRHDQTELDLLANDLLINITGFFRDPKVFDYLAAKIAPDLIKNQPEDLPLRIWIAGCSTGEEAYSLAILFQEAVLAAKSPIKLQIFASDVDPEAVATAREGLYSGTIKSEISADRLTKFFSKEGDHFRVSADLRAHVVFTVHDVLADPPFSRLDLISCRNLLIYLKPEAQTKVIALFHFALRDQGILLLGTSETVGSTEGRFSVISKPERLYRHIGRSRPGDLSFGLGKSDGQLPAKRRTADQTAARPAVLAELTRRKLMEAFAPVAVLINDKNECLHFTGATDHYLSMPDGLAIYDLISLAKDSVRTKLRSAIQQAVQNKTRIVVTGGRLPDPSGDLGFNIEVLPIDSNGENLMLVCFIAVPAPLTKGQAVVSAADLSRVAELEKELDSTRTELSAAIRNLEISGEEQKAINEEALSVNEEFQSTNEEMLTSKEELQSLNEELTALNSQLQETLERQRTTSNDLQNVLYSTDLATLFLDRDLNIRFFTPATRLLFSVIPGDVGRPLADLRSLASDTDLLSEAERVLKTLEPVEREIEAKTGAWYIRRILPYRVPGDGVEGVVITFADITERRKTAVALEAAKQDAQLANMGKSRFLAAASHDLRQPLQSLKLIQGLLLRLVEGEKALKLVGRFEDILTAITGMLNALLDINQIEAGTVHAEPVSFPINDLLNRLRGEFVYHAQAQRLELVVMPCSLYVISDPRLLEQMVRNLLNNGLKYTKTGKILVGCRRHGDTLCIEIWDTGIGIPQAALSAIFNEYAQLNNPEHDRNRGLGLGLSIVQRLSVMLGHPIRVQSQEGKGSVFSINVPINRAHIPAPAPVASPPLALKASSEKNGTILVIEDDPDERDLIDITLSGEGYRTYTASDGDAALTLIKRLKIRPDLIVSDFNLSNGMNGLELADKLHQVLHTPLSHPIPVIIMTADMSSATQHDIAARTYLQLIKPVKPVTLSQAVQRLLAEGRLKSKDVPIIRPQPDTQSQPTVFVVDDDNVFRDSIKSMLLHDGRHVEDFDSCEDFLAAYIPGTEGCLLVDAYLPGMKGVDLLQRLLDAGHHLPAVMITGNTDVTTAVLAMKAGASDFIEKPVSSQELLLCVERALEISHDESRKDAWQKDAVTALSGLTARQKQIMERVLAGEPSKNIAADLGISQRTVENHRNAIMTKTKSKSLPALARLALAAAGPANL